MRRSRPVFVLTVLTLMLGSVSPAATVVAATKDAGWLPELRYSDDLTGPTVIAGHVHGLGGLSAANARLTLVPWPLDDVLADTKEGDSIKLTPVAKALTGSDGGFLMRIDPSAPIAEFMRPDGIVNFDLIAESAGGFRVFSFSGQLTGGHWIEPNRPVEDAVADVLLTLEQAPGASASSASSATDKSCFTTVVATYNNRPTTISEVYTGPVSHATVTYTSGADSTTGIGFSPTGAYGSFESSGTMTVSSSATLGFPDQTPNTAKILRTYWGWKKYKITCAVPTYIYYEAKPYQFQGGIIQTSSATPTATYCHAYPAGSWLIRNSGTAYTHSYGADLGAVLGISFSNRTGFASDASLRYDMLLSGRICGSNTYEGSAQRIVAKG